MEFSLLFDEQVKAFWTIIVVARVAACMYFQHDKQLRKHNEYLITKKLRFANLDPQNLPEQLQYYKTYYRTRWRRHSHELAGHMYQYHIFHIYHILYKYICSISTKLIILVLAEEKRNMLCKNQASSFQKYTKNDPGLYGKLERGDYIRNEEGKSSKFNIHSIFSL